jgi:Family of unknown function (DUF6159)
VAHDTTTGKMLLRASWDALKADRELIVLPILSAVAATIAMLMIGVGGLVAGIGVAGVTRDGAAGSVLSWVVAFVMLYVTTTIAVYFQVALAAGAMQRMDGGDPDLGSCLAAANARLPQILTWALVAATVGMVLRMLSERAGVVGQLVIALVGVAWAVVTFFVVPVLLVEGPSPFQAIGRSKELMVARWGKVARSGLRFGVLLLGWYLAAVALLVVGVLGLVAGAGSSSGAVMAFGGLVLVAGVIAVVVVSLVSAAVGTYLRTVLYRYAVGLPVPGIPPQVLQSAIATT